MINPSVVADLGSSAPGILSRVHVDRSDLVEAGDVIAELESGVESASVDLARTRADSTAEVDLRRVNAGYGNRLRDRTKNLFKRKVVSSNDLDERETEARLGWIQLRQAKDNQAIAKLELVRAEEILKRRTINSPITGVVMERFKVVGEYIEDQPVARVAQLDPLHVEVIVPVEHLGGVTPGMTAEVWTEVTDGKRWLAEVMRVDKVADVASGTYGVRLALPNPDYEIPAGLRCQMQLVEAPQPVAADKTPVETEPVPVPAPTIAASAAQIAEQADSKGTVTPAPVEPAAAPEDAETEEAQADVQRPAEPETPIDMASAEKDNPQQVPVQPAEQPLAEQAARAEDIVPETVAEATNPTLEPPEVLGAGPTPLVETAQIETTDHAAEAGQVVPPVEERRACRVAGPFRNEIDATRHVVRLRRAGLDVQMQTTNKTTDVEYKVMTPVLADHAAANQVVKALEAAGLDDFYVNHMPAGKRRVYLGVYNKEQRAAKRVAALKKAGIKALFRPFRSVGADFFLVVRGRPGRDTDRLLAALPASPGGPAGELDLCERTAAVSMR